MIITCMKCNLEMQPKGEQKYLEYTLVCPKCEALVKVELVVKK